MNEIDSSTERSFRPKNNQESEPWKQGCLLVIVIGINEYQYWQKLKNAVQDAVGLQQILIDKLGFTAPIEPLINEQATKTAINNLVEDRLREILQKDDNLILFFAGHGHTRVDKLGTQTIETGYLIPVEASGSNKYSEYIEIDPFLKSVAKLPAKHILVILDSCHSGFALGEVKQYRDAVTYTKDLSSKVSRRVITSALREQPALDGGPIPGHSLFTGTLINGFNSGEADLDSNGLISSSELGLFIQQKVGQASGSKQTPDFGAFYWDDRGEMVISLRDQSFDALKVRAFSALQKGKTSLLKQLIEQIKILKKNSPEEIYLEYRIELYSSNLKKAKDAIKKLNECQSLNNIPISYEDARRIYAYLNIPEWAYKIKLNENNFPCEIDLFTGLNDASLTINQTQAIGELEGYVIPQGALAEFRIKNLIDAPIFLYIIELDTSGKIEVINFWKDQNLNFNGLPAFSTSKTILLRIDRDEFEGVNEFKFIASTIRIDGLMFAPNVMARGCAGGVTYLKNLTFDEVRKIKIKTIRYTVI
jgi:hypothetical protein